MHIWLLTHSEELKKSNGTGQLVKQVLPTQCSIITWQRTEPNAAICALPNDKTLLIYPRPEEQIDQTPAEEILNSVEHIIILDGTWQQARKMYNQSPYLHGFPKYEIIGQTSIFQRRRNQVTNGLCTAESAAFLLEKRQFHQEAEALKAAFIQHNQALPDHSTT
ncbi:DTW domain-containing protein [Marinomonas ostreistagni]|uniref:DTW domain-containing protein n=1 Tax=Marinomonas ostreistagni TaxID=359209 RepID=UPI00194E8CD8|nr:tRNA-uridine aminocarboxypropyltransferase [Marinomonas ostreistagni]MBM6551309.1 DTW domain-containing protein [Marinomonas ostreistagni]